MLTVTLEAQKLVLFTSILHGEDWLDCQALARNTLRQFSDTEDQIETVTGM